MGNDNDNGNDSGNSNGNGNGNIEQKLVLYRAEPSTM